MAIDSPASTSPPEASADSYPVSVQFDTPPTHGRLWAIPVLGILIKEVLLIPSIIALYVVGIIVSILQLGLWIPVLFSGKYPEVGVRWVGGSIRWGNRLIAYLFGLTDEYPPFTLKERTETRTFSVNTSFSTPAQPKKFWAIPALGFFVKNIILIPHQIIISVLWSVCFLAALILWIPVLFTGRYPAWGYQLVGGTIRWNTRYTTYLFGLTDKYPPFAM